MSKDPNPDNAPVVFSDSEPESCCITGRKDVVDDATITIEFGYGSTRDMQTFEFPLVQDEIAKSILEYIDSLMVGDRSIDDYKIDHLNDAFEEGYDTFREQSHNATADNQATVHSKEDVEHFTDHNS